MNFLRLFFLTACFSALSIAAQDYGPVKIDLDGYVDDRKQELVKPENEPVKEEPKKEETKKEEPKADDNPRRRRTAANSEASTPAVGNTSPSTEPAKPIKKVSLSNFKTKKKDPMMMYIIIGSVVLLLVGIIVLVVVLKKKKQAALSRRPERDDSVSLADKIEAHEQAVAAETTEGQQPVSAPPSPVEDSGISAASQQMADQFAAETAVDERGMNQSGLIIDEDKYFGDGASFVDEDFSDLDGPHDGMAPPAAPPADSPNLPPGN